MAVTKKLASCKSRLVTSHVQAASSRWSAHSIAKGVQKIGDDVSKVLMALWGEFADAILLKVSTTGSKLKNNLIRGSTQIEIKR